MKRAIVVLGIVAAALALPLLARAQGERSAQVVQGAALYAEHCASCHGADGRAGIGFQTPIWGAGTQIAKFGNAQGLFEYLQLLMPFDDPAKLTDEQKWAIAAHMLANHGSIRPADTLTPQNAAGLPIR